MRRLVQYEDYALRLLRDSGIPDGHAPRHCRDHARTRVSPGHRVLHGAVELGEADIDDEVIDQGLLLIRKLWDAGIAHRDIKPGNLMVRARTLLLIDVSFVQVRRVAMAAGGRPGPT